MIRKSILSTLMMKAIRSSETSALTRVTQHHIPKDGFHSDSRESLKSYIVNNAIKIL
jgi:hypothetical protein